MALLKGQTPRTADMFQMISTQLTDTFINTTESARLSAGVFRTGEVIWAQQWGPSDTAKNIDHYRT